MSWAAAGDTPYRVTTIDHASSNWLGPLGIIFQKIVKRGDGIKPGSANTPHSRPVDALDWRAVVRFLDPSSIKAETTAAGTITVAGTTGDGGSFSHAMGPFLPGSSTHTYERNPEGMPTEQECEGEGTSLTNTITV